MNNKRFVAKNESGASGASEQIDPHFMCATRWFLLCQKRFAWIGFSVARLKSDSPSLRARS